MTSRVRVVDDPNWAGGTRFDVYFTRELADRCDFTDGQSMSRRCVEELLWDLGRAYVQHTAEGMTLAAGLHHLVAHPLLFLTGGARWAQRLHDASARWAWPRGTR